MSKDQETLPQELQFGVPPTVPQARSYVFSIPATDDNYTPGGKIQIDIPRLQRSYLTKDSALTFDATVAWIPGTGPSVTCCLDSPGAASLFDSLEVYDYMGSTLLERVEGYALLAGIIDDVTSPKSGALLGDGKRNPTKYPATESYAYDANQAWEDGPPQSGASFYNNHAGSATTTQTKQFVVRLNSFLGNFSEKFVPLHNGFTIMLTLNPAYVALGIADTSSTSACLVDTTANYESLVIKNVAYRALILELSAEAEVLLQSTTGSGPMVVHSKAWRHYYKPQTSEWTQKTTWNVPLNLNVASLTTILFCMRDASYINKFNFRSLSNRIRNFLQSFIFHYGSSVLPNSNGVSTRYTKSCDEGGYEGFLELRRALRAKDWEVGCITRPSWNRDITVKGANSERLNVLFANEPDGNVFPPTVIGAFAGGLSTELTPQTTPGAISGLNTNGMSTWLELIFDPTVLSTGFDAIALAADQKTHAFVLDAFLEYDAFISVVPGIATSVAF